MADLYGSSGRYWRCGRRIEAITLFPKKLTLADWRKVSGLRAEVPV